MKKAMYFLAQLLLISALATSFVACDNDDDDDGLFDDENIIEFAEDNDDFELLVQAADKADLTDFLATTTPLTLFAPTDDALQDYLDAAGTTTIENTPANILGNVLTNHVLSGNFEADDLETGYYSTVSSASVEPNFSTLMYVNADNDILINGEVSLMETDEDVENGTIHTIGEVIAPPTVVTFVTADPNFDMLQEALTRTDLSIDFVAILTGEGPFTVFAPTNEAFQNLLDSNNDWNELKDIPADVLEKVLSYHVNDESNVRSTELTSGMTVNTLAANEDFTIDLSGASPQIIADANTAEIIAADIQAENGVIHVVDEVLLPEEL